MVNHKSDSLAYTLVKLLFKLASDSLHASATETLWAEPVGKDEYRLENVPFYIFDVSFGDTVHAKSQDGMLVFAEVIRRGGHSTYRIRTNPNRRDAFETFWDPIRAHGCTYEEGPPPLLAVDVPPKASILDVYKSLEEGELAGVWSFEEGHCGHPTQ